MILRGVLVAASGFLFIFSPGLPIGLLSRRSPPFRRDLIYWGMGIWAVTLLPSLFVQSLLRQLISGNQVPSDRSITSADFGLALLGALLTAIFVQGVMALVLRRSRPDDRALPPNGLAVGFGIGLIAQVFTGLSLIGAGFRLMYGDISTSTLASLAEVGLVTLLLGLLSLILFRPALLVVSAAQGVLVACALRSGWRFLWLAVLLQTSFIWVILALQLALGSESPGQLILGTTDPLTSFVTIVYYLLAFVLAYRWLLTQMAAWGKASAKRKG